MTAFMRDFENVEFKKRGPLSAITKSKIARALRGKKRGVVGRVASKTAQAVRGLTPLALTVGGGYAGLKLANKLTGNQKSQFVWKDPSGVLGRNLARSAGVLGAGGAGWVAGRTIQEVSKHGLKKGLKRSKKVAGRTLKTTKKLIGQDLATPYNYITG